LIFGSFIGGVLVWGFRCGVSTNRTNRKLIRVLYTFFATISLVMVLSVGFFLLLLYSLYIPAYFLLVTIVLWEVVSEAARRI